MSVRGRAVPGADAVPDAEAIPGAARASDAAIVPARVGRHGIASCDFERARGRTILRDDYSRVPLQVVRPLYPEGLDGPAHLTLVNPTGGHVGGDRLDANVRLGRNAHVLWTTQGATKVYRSLGNPVVSTMAVQMAPGAVLEAVPDPVIPYKGALYRQEIDVHMQEDARLLCGEILYPGRVAAGEFFDYAEVALRFRARLDDAPLLNDAMVVRPSDRFPDRLGMFEPHPYLGSFYVLGGDPQTLAAVAAATEEAFRDGAEGVVGGATLLEGPGVMIRWLARTPVLAKRTFDRVWGLARRTHLGRPAVRLRKY